MKKQSIQHTTGEESWLERIEDLVFQATTYSKPRFTPFLKPNEQELILRYLGKRIPYMIFGGFDEAEMKQIGILVEDVKEFPIACLISRYQNKYIQLTHRDVLGAVMNLGLDRNRFGDLFVLEDKIILYVHADLVEYISMHLRKIHQVQVEFKESEEFYIPTIRLKYMIKIVSSLRLDNMVGVLANLSRSKAKEYIEMDKVAVNGSIQCKTTLLIEENDILSIRGSGKYKIVEIKSEKTKKENRIIEIAKYE